MQHTLIPTIDRQRLHHEYYLRALTVLFCILALAILVGGAALFPAYMRAWLAYRSAESAMAAARAIKAEAGVDDAKAELDRDQALVEALGTASAYPFSDALRQVIAARGGIVLTSFAMSRPDAKSLAISLRGTAPTRDDLLAFASRLEAAFPGAKAAVPIEQLAKSSNLQFSIQFLYRQQ